jgi:hypothetical protein
MVVSTDSAFFSQLDDFRICRNTPSINASREINYYKPTRQELFPTTPFLASDGHLMSDYPTSMIGLCQEGKSSPDALRRSAGVNLF